MLEPDLVRLCDAQRLDADERHQVHTRVEARFLLIDTPGGGFRSRASRDDVRSAPEEFQGQVRGQTLRTGEPGGRTGDRHAPVRTRTQKRRNGIPLQADALIDAKQVPIRACLPRLDLTHARQCLETEIVPLAEQGHRLRAQSQRLRCVVSQRV